ncbi:hypothetical protein SUGI_0980860 [Cryptomeria japonica]|nr:hypothetical protein SUGI_0980860 [Cryptomeria japonica]
MLWSTFTGYFTTCSKSIDKMNDLLSRSFKRYGNLREEAMNDLESGHDVEMISINTEKNLGKFFDEIGDVKNDMDLVEGLLKKLQDANEESKTIHNAKTMKNLRDRMDKDIEIVLKKSKLIKGKLEALDNANIANHKLPGCGRGTPTDRTRTSVVNGLRKKLKDLMGDFQVLRQKIMGEYRETIERRYYTVTGEHADEETIENIIQTGDSENFLQKAIQEQGRGHVLDTVHEIRERHDAAMELERNLLDLHQIFLDMAVLVEAQGEQLNDIEHHVTNAASFVNHGAQQLQVAKKHQRSSRKSSMKKKK